MTEKIHDRILFELKKMNSLYPLEYFTEEELEKSLQLKHGKFRRGIKHLAKKRLIDVQWLYNGAFVAKINNRGLHAIRKETQRYPAFD